MATRTLATSEDRDSEIPQRCGCELPSSYAESCSAPSSRRHVENVHSVGVDVDTRYARHETCTRNQQIKPAPTQPSHSPTRTTQHAKIRNQTWQYIPEPPAKIATPTFGSDVAARQHRATLRAAVLQAPDVTMKMSTALDQKLPAAQRMRLEYAISKPTTAHSTIPFPNPRNTTRKGTKKKHGNTYSSHQRRSQLRHSAAIWLQEILELR
jgi:hypothetical protein